MIHYNLTCSRHHGFQGWFSSSTDFEAQSEAKLIACPICEDHSVIRAPMAPHIARHSRMPPGNHSPASNSPTPQPSEAANELSRIIGEFSKSVEANCDYVGKEFPEEARKIHYGESDPRGIYGEASKDDVVALKDEGIAIAPIPWIKKGDA